MDPCARVDLRYGLLFAGCNVCEHCKVYVCVILAVIPLSCYPSALDPRSTSALLLTVASDTTP